VVYLLRVVAPVSHQVAKLHWVVAQYVICLTYENRKINKIMSTERGCTVCLLKLWKLQITDKIRAIWNSSLHSPVI
jgi:hypothetical protein